MILIPKIDCYRSDFLTGSTRFCPKFENSRVLLFLQMSPLLRAPPRLHILQHGPGGGAGPGARRLPLPRAAQGRVRLRRPRSRPRPLRTVLRARSSKGAIAVKRR